MLLPEDMATLSCSNSALQLSTWLRVNSWEFKELLRDLLNPHIHRLVNYVWGHVITRFSSSSVREDGLADFHTSYNMPGHCWIQIQFAAVDTTSAHASYRQRCQCLQWQQRTSCHYLQNQYTEKSIYAPTTAFTTASEHLSWQMYTWSSDMLCATTVQASLNSFIMCTKHGPNSHSQ